MPPITTDLRVECINPILRVADIAASLRFYVDLLGFTNAPWGGADFTCVSRDGALIYLCQADRDCGGTWMWIGIEDVAALHAALTARGVAIRKPPTKRPWALEMEIEDPDGNLLRFGSDPD
jgi:catechol 2,3-dioxygenase-like lactoylglutathione lyase family enzyme